MSYYNTTHLSEGELKVAKAKCDIQENYIKSVFVKRLYEYLGAWDVWNICKRNGYKWPLTSVRRAITDLTNQKILAMTDIKVPNGRYGRKCYKYTLNNKLL